MLTSTSSSTTDVILGIRDAMDRMIESSPGSMVMGADYGSRVMGADYTGGRIKGKDFRGFDLKRVSFHGAEVTGSDFRGVDLGGADLRGALFMRCRFEGVDLTGALLSGCSFRGTDLRGVRGLPVVADAPERLRKVAKHAVEHRNWTGLWSDGLDMLDWGGCIAGQAIRMEGVDEFGENLAQVHGPEIAGLMLLGPDAHRHFYTLSPLGLRAYWFLKGVYRSSL